MALSRYSKYPFIQPIRKISVSNSDISYTFKNRDNIDSLADHYYHDVNLGWVIMCGNPQYKSEWFIKPGDSLRIPFPLDRVWREWGYSSEL